MIDYMIKIYQKKFKISMPNIFTLRYDKEILFLLYAKD